MYFLQQLCQVVLIKLTYEDERIVHGLHDLVVHILSVQFFFVWHAYTVCVCLCVCVCVCAHMRACVRLCDRMWEKYSVKHAERQIEGEEEKEKCT